MSRPLSVLAVLFAFSSPVTAADPRPEQVERALGLQQAIGAAEQQLKAGHPAEAVEALEARLADADGNQAYLDLLRRAYTADLQRLETSANTDPATLAKARRKLDLLGGPLAKEPKETAPASPEPTKVQAARGPINPFRTGVVPPAAPDHLGAARDFFRNGKYAEATAEFAAAKEKKPLTADETAAWAYCRIKVAADRLNRPGCDAATAAVVEKELVEALALVPDKDEMQQLGKNLLAMARQRKAAPAATPGGSNVPADWQTIETPSFIVRFRGERETAEKLAKAAEARREELFKLWSGPPGGAWGPKCEIVLHPTAECYAKMTGKPAAGMAHATVKLVEGRAASRRIDLQADDAAVLTNALPREITHVVLADLFPYTPPPKWAEEGMAVLAGSPEEIGRYLRTLPRCASKGELFTVAALLEMKDFPAADKVTGFYCGSVSLVDFLVKLKGEKHFTTFLRDSQRYGAASALKRQYGIDSPKALQEAWLRAALDSGRATNQ